MQEEKKTDKAKGWRGGASVKEGKRKEEEEKIAVIFPLLPIGLTRKVRERGRGKYIPLRVWLNAIDTTYNVIPLYILMFSKLLFLLFY